MFRYIAILFLIISISCISSLPAAVEREYQPSIHIECAPCFQKNLDQILQLPEARELIQAIQEEGPISIAIAQAALGDQFGAYWDLDRRVINVGLSSNVSDGEVIGSILFELQNARVNAQLNQLDDLASAGKIDRESYVRGVEHLEYLNSLRAAKMADKGIRMGIFPADARLPTYSSFEEHYHMQQVGGHSAWIGRTYDQLTS